MYKVKRIIKIIFILTMLVLNIIYVALPSIQKYLEEEIMIEVENISPENLDPPAISFATIGGSEKDGG